MPRARKQQPKVEIEPLVEAAMKDEDELKKHVELMSEGKRRERQISSNVVYEIAVQDISRIQPYTQDICDALNRPEGQTRWEALQTLTLLVDLEPKKCATCVEAAELALFDEDSATLRYSAFVFLCTLGKTTEARSKEVWPLIDDAIQCYHGDVEFDDMLDSVIEFSEGKLDEDVKKGLAARMKFDAENATGKLKTKSNIIVNNVSSKKKTTKKK